jgi:hypothetical protein
MALFHDAHEAYVGDLTRPLQQALKHLIGPKFQNMWFALTTGIQNAIHQALGLPGGCTATTAGKIKLADTRALDLERRFIMAPSQREWGTLCEPFETKCRPLGVLPTAAALLFVDRYTLLMQRRHGVDYRAPHVSSLFLHSKATGWSAPFATEAEVPPNL